MKIFLEKLKSVVKLLEEEYGPILVFALFLREEPLEKWDIVVSATWLKSDDMNSYKILVPKIQNALTGPELMQVARIVILDHNDPAVSFLQESESVTNGHYGEVPSDSFSERFGFTIKKAYLLRCQKI